MDNCVFTEGLVVRCAVDNNEYICSHIDEDGNYVYKPPYIDFTIRAKNNSQFRPQYPLKWYNVVYNKFYNKINPFLRLIKEFIYGDIDELEFDSQIEHYKIPDDINKESPAYKYFSSFVQCFKEFYEATKITYNAQYELVDKILKQYPDKVDYQSTSDYYVNYYNNVLRLPYRVSNTAAKRIALADILNGEIVVVDNLKDKDVAYKKLYAKYSSYFTVGLSETASIVGGYLERIDDCDDDNDDYDDDEDEGLDF